MKRFLTLMLALAMLTGLCAPACAETPQELVFTSTDWTEGVDFCQAEWWPDIASIVCDSLFIREHDGSLTPRMCTGYTVSEDGKTITMTLADDLKYHDGTAVTPADVKRSIEWAKEVSVYAGDFAAIETIDADEHTITLHLSSYSPSILFYMGHNFWPTIKASDIDTMTPDELRWNATSYGPYYVDEYVAGSHVVLKRNEYYKTYNEHVTNKGVEPVETVRVRFTTDSFAIVQGMLANEIDFTYDVAESNIAELAGNPDVVTEWCPTTAVFRMALNPADPLFSDANVRTALSLLLNREKIAAYSDGVFSPAYAFTTSDMLDFDATVPEYYRATYCDDAERGKQLLTESGWADTDGDGYLDKDGQKLEFDLMYGDDVQKTIFEFMQTILKDDGIQVNGQMVDAGTFYTSVTAGGTYQAALMVFAWGDTATTLPYLVPDMSILDFEAFYGGCLQASSIVDSATRTTAFGDLQKQLLDTTCLQPVVMVNSLRTYNSKRLTNLYFDENGFIYLNDVQ